MKNNFSPYSGRWIAVIDDKVVGQGGTPDKALQAAAATRYKETAKVVFVPTKIPLKFSPYLHQICDVFFLCLCGHGVFGANGDGFPIKTIIHDGGEGGSLTGIERIARVSR